jgi:hypothetical protein
MGLDVGPGGKLWYVDAGLARVIRLDVFPDGDGDGIRDSLDNCPGVANTDQNNHDGDLLGDFCDPDGDGDGVLNDDEGDCGYGEIGWTSTPSTDYDGDGCRDSTEDVDDDSDGLQDGDDDCEKGELGWTSDPTTDYDMMISSAMSVDRGPAVVQVGRISIAVRSDASASVPLL